MDEFLTLIKDEDIYIEPEESVFNGVFRAYEKVVIESLLTAFALDFLGDLTVQHGGDVDTVHNVNQIGKDLQMDYKNASNAFNYANRGDYTHKDVEMPYSDGRKTNFQTIKANAKKWYGEDPKNHTIKDAYEGKQLYFLGKSKNRPTELSAELDHVIAAKEIHDDRGRVLAGITTKDLADSERNLRWTNEHLNKSMGKTDIPRYIEEHPELPEDTKQRMMKEYTQAVEDKNTRIIQEYYFNLNNPNCRQFYKDTALAAGKQGIQMGVTQVVGYVFSEVWIVTKEELHSLPTGCDFPEILRAVGEGIEKGFKQALSNWKEVLAKFGEGALAGILASLATTLCNIFFTTSKFFIKNIRQIMASVIRSTRVLLINPDDLELGQRIKVSTIVMATGAATLAGSYVGVKVGEVVGGVPIVGGAITRFCSALVTGLLSCTFLLFMDRSAFINDLVDLMNKIPTEVTDLQRISEYLEIYAARLSAIDLEQFKKDTEKYQDVAEKIEMANSEEELNNVLRDAYKHFDLPWEGDFNEFMSNRNNQLVFE